MSTQQAPITRLPQVPQSVGSQPIGSVTVYIFPQDFDALRKRLAELTPPNPILLASVAAHPPPTWWWEDMSNPFEPE
ncbi:MAG: hypothetical protein V2A79_13135 [Planctomycetota bacterium]